jgi:hypothetical protein
MEEPEHSGVYEKVSPDARSPGEGRPAGDDQRALSTARALLAPDRVGVTLEERPPDPPLHELQARAGFGAVAAGHDVRINVYVLDRWGRGHEHIRPFIEQAEAEGREVCTAVNGVLLFVGTAAGDDFDAEIVLRTLGSAFAGQE